MHLQTVQFTLRRSVSVGNNSPYLAPKHFNSATSLDADSDENLAEFYPAVHGSPMASRPRQLGSATSETSIAGDDEDEEDSPSALDLPSVSSLAASNRILNDPSLASNPQKQLRLNAMTIQQGTSDLPAGVGGPLTATSASMTSHFGDGYSSLSRKSVPAVRFLRRPWGVGVCIGHLSGQRKGKKA